LVSKAEETSPLYAFNSTASSLYFSAPAVRCDDPLSAVMTPPLFRDVCNGADVLETKEAQLMLYY
jgi:hypothetical protein